MAEMEVQSARPDLDIANDIHDILARHPQLAQDRHRVRVTVTNGAVALSGHMKSPMSRRYFVERVAIVPNATSVDASGLYTEEDIRLAAGMVVPEGLLVNVRYGSVIVTGAPLEGVNLDEVVARLKAIPGVEQVVTSVSA